MGPTDCPETSVINYHYSLRNNPEEHSSRLLRGGSLKSNNRIVRHGLDSSGLDLTGYSEHDNEPSGSIKCSIFLN